MPSEQFAKLFGEIGLAGAAPAALREQKQLTLASLDEWWFLPIYLSAVGLYTRAKSRQELAYLNMVAGPVGVDLLHVSGVILEKSIL